MSCLPEKGYNRRYAQSGSACRQGKGFKPKNSPTFKCLIPLAEIISEAIEVGVNSKAVQREYMKLVSALGNEMKILQDENIEKIKSVSSSKIGDGIERVRKGNISINPGYDGEYGTIKVFGSDEKKKR